MYVGSVYRKCIPLIFRMYGQLYDQKRNYIEGYEKFVQQSLERINAHLGNYGGGYTLKPQQKPDYTFK